MKISTKIDFDERLFITFCLKSIKIFPLHDNKVTYTYKHTYIVYIYTIYAWLIHTYFTILYY